MAAPASSSFHHGRTREGRQASSSSASSSSLVLFRLAMTVAAAVLLCCPATAAAEALSNESLITLHSRLLSKQDMLAFHQQLHRRQLQQSRRLHLRGHHDDNTYHDIAASPTAFYGSGSSSDSPSLGSGDEMGEGTMEMEMMMLSKDEMEAKMDVCRTSDDNDDPQAPPPSMDCLGPAEHTVIMELLNHHDQIVRTTVPVFDTATGRFVGVLANTTSADPRVAAYLQAHVQQMHQLEVSGHKLRQWDPLYKEMFQQLEGISMEHEFLDDGISVLHTGQTECAIELIQKHAAVVTSFVQEGYEAVWREHHVPEVCYRDE